MVLNGNTGGAPRHQYSIDLTPIRDDTGPARLLAMVEGRSKQAFKTWLAARPKAWRDAVEVVAMDGFTGFKTAATEELPDATPVLDPFHVVRLAGDALDQCRRRIQQDLHGHRGRAADPLYRARRMLHTGVDLLAPRQKTRLAALFAGDDHVEVETTWGIYQKMIAAYREPDKAKGKTLMQAVIDAIGSGVPGVLIEVITLGRTLKKRAADILAYFDRPGTSNGPTEALNGRLEHLRVERPHRSPEWPTRTPPRQRPRLPEPRPLHRPQPPRDRRLQTPTRLHRGL